VRWKIDMMTKGIWIVFSAILVVMGYGLFLARDVVSATPYSTTADYYNSEFLGRSYSPEMWNVVTSFEMGPESPTKGIHILRWYECAPTDGTCDTVEIGEFPSQEECIKELNARIRQLSVGGVGGGGVCRQKTD
jgi:hypothetical protein